MPGVPDFIAAQGRRDADARKYVPRQAPRRRHTSEHDYDPAAQSKTDRLGHARQTTQVLIVRITRTVVLARESTSPLHCFSLDHGDLRHPDNATQQPETIRVKPPGRFLRPFRMDVAVDDRIVTRASVAVESQSSRAPVQLLWSGRNAHQREQSRRGPLREGSGSFELPPLTRHYAAPRTRRFAARRARRVACRTARVGGAGCSGCLMYLMVPAHCAAVTVGFRAPLQARGAPLTGCLLGHRQYERLFRDA